MKQIRFPILLVTLFALVYNSLIFFDVEDNLIFALFCIAPFAMAWMVYRILKDGTPAGKTWDEQFYEDHYYRRNGREDQGEFS